MFPQQYRGQQVRSCWMIVWSTSIRHTYPWSIQGNGSPNALLLAQIRLGIWTSGECIQCLSSPVAFPSIHESTLSLPPFLQLSQSGPFSSGKDTNTNGRGNFRVYKWFWNLDVVEVWWLLSVQLSETGTRIDLTCNTTFCILVNSFKTRKKPHRYKINHLSSLQVSNCAGRREYNAQFRECLRKMNSICWDCWEKRERGLNWEVRSSDMPARQCPSRPGQILAAKWPGRSIFLFGFFVPNIPH